MPRLKFIVAYDGTELGGWQSQTHRNTVQDHLETAFKRVVGERLVVHGAGRTDAGVHALAQCAHVDLKNRRLPIGRWPTALNTFLPSRIRVLRACYVSENFHARFSAKGKVYRYRIWRGPVLPPFECNRAWHVKEPLDFVLLKEAATLFVGRHNFRAFAANRGKPPENTIREIRSIKIRRHGAAVMIECDGDGFLYRMVRLMTGAIVGCGLRKFQPERIRDELRSGRSLGPRLSAPAEGLYLVRVRY